MRTPNTCPCPLTRGVRLWEVKNAVFERRNRRDHSLCPLMGGVRLREVSVSGGSTVVSRGEYVAGSVPRVGILVVHYQGLMDI